MDSNHEPKLAPPGAGLPIPELFIARLLFAVKRLTGNRAAFTSKFQEEREAIRNLVNPLSAESAARRVLIPRPRGLEDSSRYWSVWMTLDHLRIVHQSIIRVIGALSKGVTPEGRASTAAVKPNPEVDATVVSDYEKSCDDLLALVASVKDLNTAARYPHPWFGPLNAAGWQALSATHLSIHRVQIERILEGIKRAIEHIHAGLARSYPGSPANILAGLTNRALSTECWPTAILLRRDADLVTLGKIQL